MIKNVITTTLLVILAVAVGLLSYDLKEQEALIDELVEKHNAHLSYTQRQTDVLVRHQKDIESIVEHLLEGRSFVSYR